MQIQIPHNYKPREYQLPLWSCLGNGYKRAVAIWHRRCGKDITLFNLTIKEAIKKKGTYWYLFPTYTQAKKVIWDGINKDGFKFRDFIPKELKERENGTELTIELINGSVIQLIGTDKFDNIRGVSLAGCVFSEYAFHNPIVWDVVRPILAESGGWAIFNSTPNGKNHFYELYQMGIQNEKWFTERLTVEDTKAVKQEVIQDDRESGMTEEMVQQEYYCSFDVGAIGSYYMEQINKAREEKRITQLPINSYTKVDIFIDIGANDAFTLWFKQDDGQFFNFIHYFEDNGKVLDYYYNYIDEFLLEKGLKLRYIYIPHDGKNKGHSFLVSGETIYESFEKRFGKEHIKYVERPKSINDGIQAVRKIFNRVRIDEIECKQGLNCLESYKKKYDERRKVFLDHPLHDWASHGADSFRYFAIVEGKEKKVKKKMKVVFTDYSDFL